MKKKIIVVAPRYKALSGGGEYFIYRFIKDVLEPNQISYEVFVRNEKGKGVFFISNNVIEIETWVYLSSRNILHRFLRNLSLFLFEIRVALDIVRNNKKDSVLVFAANLYYLPILLKFYSVKTRLHGPPGKLKACLLKFFKIDLIANGDALLSARKNGLLVQEIRVFPPEVFSKDLCCYNDDVLYVGRFERIKGFDILLKEALELNLPKLTVIGDGSLKHSPEYHELKNCSWFCNKGVLEREQVYELMKCHAVLALLSRYDNLPNVILEGIAVGMKLWLSTDIPVYKELESLGLASSTYHGALGLRPSIESRRYFLSKYTSQSKDLISDIWL